MIAVPRFLAVALAAVEGGLLALLAAGQLVELVTDGRLGAVPVAVFFAACSSAVLWCARGLAMAQSWSRGPLVAAQLLLLALTWTYHRPYPLAAAVLATVAALTLAGLLLPSTTRALTRTS
ncbi:hypothetical protein BH20ACT6_BH20ACT6_12730 [soil metagenome]